jgi:hypothetical protein
MGEVGGWGVWEGGAPSNVNGEVWRGAGAPPQNNKSALGSNSIWDENFQTTFTFAVGHSQHLGWDIRWHTLTGRRGSREAGFHPSHTLR